MAFCNPQLLVMVNTLHPHVMSCEKLHCSSTCSDMGPHLSTQDLIYLPQLLAMVTTCGVGWETALLTMQQQGSPSPGPEHFMMMELPSACEAACSHKH